MKDKKKALGRNPKTLVAKPINAPTRAQRHAALRQQAQAATTVLDLAAVVAALIAELDG